MRIRITTRLLDTIKKALNKDSTMSFLSSRLNVLKDLSFKFKEISFQIFTPRI